VLVPADRAVQDDGAVVVGVRPEKVHLLGPGEEVPADANAVGPARVVDVSYSGVSTQYLVDLPGAGGSHRLAVFAQNVGAAPRARPGDEVHLAWQVRHTFALRGDEDARAGVEDLADGDG
jgi:spermidine/putrescine transport system ATP-binding protein